MHLFNQCAFMRLFKGSYIVLDTSSFIRLSVEDKDYIDIFKQLTSMQPRPSFLTIDIVKYEFVRGPEKEGKSRLYAKLIDELDTLVVNSLQLESYYDSIVHMYGKLGSKVSVTDLFLASILLKYQHIENIYLFTENFLDFPHNFFTPIFIINKYDKINIKPLVFYKLNNAAVVKFQDGKKYIPVTKHS